MRELVRTNDIVILSFITSLLNDADIGSAILDQNMSIVEGSIGALSKRLMVATDDYNQARRILVEAGLEEWVKGE